MGTMVWLRQHAVQIMLNVGSMLGQDLVAHRALNVSQCGLVTRLVGQMCFIGTVPRNHVSWTQPSYRRYVVATRLHVTLQYPQVREQSHQIRLKQGNASTVH